MVRKVSAVSSEAREPPANERPMDANTETVNEILRRHLATERDYASYWKFSLDRQLEERRRRVPAGLPRSGQGLERLNRCQQ